MPQSAMKTFKLCVHKPQKKNNQDILVSPKDFSDVKAGDVLELYHPDDEWNRLLLQVKNVPEDPPQKDTVSVEQGIASVFNLRPYNNVVVNKVDPKNVGLDLVELLFKEQYFGRSDMWRMCKTLTNTCVYLKKPIEYVEMRATVNELWARGENVTSGVITDDTRIVFRSPTAVVQIFIQMSTEMWDFDLHGDLYFEKAVNGFLTDLFDKWKDQNCLHDVTIVLFSRTFYEAKSLDEFPVSVRECLQVDSKGRVYEDFYRVIVQNERYEEWTSVLRKLRTLFNVYPSLVLNYHEHGQQGWKMPKSKNSVASQGNFLETLNMSLNLFENYYLDRNFDRTGKVSVVITPGPGVFEVDRQLANITKQRTIDCGVGSDLVCMGEQPLHAAPLFKFHSKSSNKSIEVGDDYNIPHWMNHSFYMSKNQIEDHMNSSFVPRIKPPPALLKELEEGPKLTKKNLLPRKDDSNDDNIPFVDYDEYDAQVFKLPHGTMPRTFSARGANLNVSRVGFGRNQVLPKTFAEAKQRLKPRQRHISDEVSAYMNGHKDSGKDISAAISIPNCGASKDDMSYSFGCYPIHDFYRSSEKAMSRDSFESSESDELVLCRPVVGSAGSPVSHSRNLQNYRPHRALINPFAPSRLQFKMTSNRRRWVHAFPVDQKGVAMQARHVHSVAHSDHENDFPWSDKESVQSPTVTVTTASTRKQRQYMGAHGGRDSDHADEQSQGGESMTESPVLRFEHSSSVGSKRTIFDTSVAARNKHGLKLYRTKMFGFSENSSEQDWSPDMNTAVDWKSLTIPVSLPVTTDYFPDRRSLQYDYVVSEYELLPEDVNAEIWASWSRSPTCEDKTLLVYRRRPLKTNEVFLELISQRLGQGFQLITKKKHRLQLEPKQQLYHSQTSTSHLMRASKKTADEEYYMSIGRIYHKLTLSGQTIRVTRYWPRHPQAQLYYEYRYRFQAPDSFSSDVSWTNFSNEKLENYNWNHLDQYICTQGDWEYGLIDPLKYWRARFFLLPLNNQATKKIIDKETARCDIYEEKSHTELQQLISGFLKFLETMNKLRRVNTQRKSKMEANMTSSAVSGGSGAESSPRKPDDGNKEKKEKLNASAPLKIIEAMVDPGTGVNLIQNQTGLPMNTFISAEAVTWCRQNVMSIISHDDGVALMQKLVDEQLVLHGSGNTEHKFIYGFYLYYIPQKVLNKAAPATDAPSHPTTHLNTPGANHNCLFQNEWCEVSVLPVKAEEIKDVVEEKESGKPRPKFFVLEEAKRKCNDSLLDPEFDDWQVLTGHKKKTDYNPDYRDPYYSGGVRLNDYYRASLLHKYTNVEVDPHSKSERSEFAMARYHAYYSPRCAFEIQLQWMVATGCVLGDLVYAYARRASLCGFHLIPVPCDPFALPYTDNSDPLRGPIFVPLNMQAFDENLFENCSDEKRQEMLYVLQESIVKRFGFLPVSVKVPKPPENTGSGNRCVEEGVNYNHQYVHCTAGMFILVPESNPSPPSPPVLPSASRLSASTASPQPSTEAFGMTKKSSSDLHKLYIARQGRPESAPNKVGFLWSWNYMSSRRWRSPHTGDETFQDTMLADFRKFCSNDENRLTEFWVHFKASVNDESFIARCN